MKTLNREGFRTPMAKILAGVFLASSLTIVPMVWAEEGLPNIANIAEVVMEKYRFSKRQLDNLLLVNTLATKSNRPEVIQALMLKESGANDNAKSAGNCHGVLQIMTSTAQGILKNNTDLRTKYFGESTPNKAVVTKRLKTDPAFSIEVADRIVAYELDRGHSIERAVLAYNMGSVAASRQKSPTKYAYVTDVMRKVNMITVPMKQLFEPAPIT